MVGLRSRYRTDQKHKQTAAAWPAAAVMAVAVADVAVVCRTGHTRKPTCAADAGGTPPPPPLDGRPAASAVMANSHEGEKRPGSVAGVRSRYHHASRLTAG